MRFARPDVSDAHYIAEQALTKAKNFGGKNAARLTVHWPKRSIMGSWCIPGFVIWAASFYEYTVGVPATVEYRRRPA